MKKVLVLIAVIALLSVSCKTSKISLPQGTSETAQITSDEPVNTPAESKAAANNDDWLSTDKDFAVPDPQEPEEIANYEEVHGESPEMKAAREKREQIEKEEAERREAERLAAQKAAEEEAAKIAAAKKAAEEKAEADRIAAKKLEEEKKRAIAEAEKKAKAEQREAERLAEKKAEEERKAKAAAARKAEAERREAERAAAKKAEEERKAREKAEAEAKRAKEKEEKAAALAREEAERKLKEEAELKRKEEAKKAEEERILAEAAARRAALERQAEIDAAKVTPAIDDAPYTVETLDKTPSRSVRVLVNQYLDVSYPGAGWVYLGEVDESQNLISFANRELDNSDTCFTLRAIQSGTSVLHFYKQDVLTGTYIDDFLEVVVLPQQYKGNEHQVAPLYSEIVPPNQRKYTARRSNNAQTQTDSSKNSRPTVSPVKDETLQDDYVYDELPELEEDKSASSQKPATDKTVNRTIQIDESAPKAETKSNKEAPKENVQSLPTDIQNYSAAQLIEAAKKAYENKKYDESLSLLNLFFDKATSGLDEGWYLKGQLYESPNASFRNIRTARESYQALVDRYPSSTLWKKANNRILYIDRYYFKIR